MERLWTILSDYTFQVVALGSALIGMISGMLGCFAVLRRQSLLGDAVSHTALPGVVLAFLITGSKNTELLLLGALVSGLIASLFILGILRHSRVKFDSALALVLSVFFGLGLVLLTYAQKQPNANQAGLNRFIFGQASTLLERDLVIMLLVGGVLLILTILFWKEIKLSTFDREYAQSLGFSSGKLDLLVSAMIVLSIIIGLQTVGAILMSAMLISPAVAARQWTNRFGVMTALAALFGAASGISGTIISSMVPRFPTGPAIAVAVSAIVLTSLMFAPGRGVLARMHRQRKNRRTWKNRGKQGVSAG